MGMERMGLARLKPRSLRYCLTAKAQVFWQEADRLSHGTLGILASALTGMLDARAPEAAASIAYYALFSFFPLIIILISLGSTFLEAEEAQEHLLIFLRDALPFGDEFIQENLQRLALIAEDIPSVQEVAAENVRRFLELRKPAGILASAGLLWSATSVFVVLTYNVDRAWNGTERRNFLKGRLAGLVTVLILAVLLIASLVATAILGFLAQVELPLPFLGDVFFYDTFVWKVFSRLVPPLLAFLMALSLYRWAPKAKVRWRNAAWGAFAATLCWELSKMGFGWYLASEFSRQQLIYGSLGTVVALMIWVYLTGFIVLFGAHLSAAIDR